MFRSRCALLGARIPASALIPPPSFVRWLMIGEFDPLGVKGCSAWQPRMKELRGGLSSRSPSPFHGGLDCVWVRQIDAVNTPTQMHPHPSPSSVAPGHARGLQLLGISWGVWGPLCLDRTLIPSDKSRALGFKRGDKAASYFTFLFSRAVALNVAKRRFLDFPVSCQSSLCSLSGICLLRPSQWGGEAVRGVV